MAVVPAGILSVFQAGGGEQGAKAASLPVELGGLFRKGCPPQQTSNQTLGGRPTSAYIRGETTVMSQQAVTRLCKPGVGLGRTQGKWGRWEGGGVLPSWPLSGVQQESLFHPWRRLLRGGGKEGG